MTVLFTSGTLELNVARLDVEPEAVRAAMAVLSEGERQRACRFAFERDRRRFTVARGGLRKQLAVRLGRQPESIELVCSAQGKPALERRRGDPDLRFNVSHSEDLAIYGFSVGREIGVDVEAVRHVADADETAMRYFSRRENEAYLALDPSDRLLGFFNCWTRKEAFVKALGEGLFYPLDRFDVSLAPGEPARILRIGSSPLGGNGWSMQSFSPARGFIAAVVTEDFSHEAIAGNFCPPVACSG